MEKATSGPIKPAGTDRWLAVLSDPAPDCVGDQLLDWTWADDLPLMTGHDYQKLPVGRVQPFKENGRLMGWLVFPPEGTSRDSDEARRLIHTQTVKAVSVGFSPVPGHKVAGNAYGGYDYKLVKVNEVSLVFQGCCASCTVSG